MSHADKILAVCNEIANVRAGQYVLKGYTVEHDDTHDKGELAEAAAAYAIFSTEQEGADEVAADLWPLEWHCLQPKADRRRNLIIAAALLVAEIERLDRAALKASKGEA